MITQEYEKGMDDYRRNLHGLLLMNKGDKPLTTRDMPNKLSVLWKSLGQWKLISLGMEFC